MGKEFWRNVIIVGAAVALVVLVGKYLLAPAEPAQPVPPVPVEISVVIPDLGGRTTSQESASNTFSGLTLFTNTTTVSNDFIPADNNISRLGVFTKAFKDLFVSSTAWFAQGVKFGETVPADTSNALYQSGDALFFDGAAVHTAGGASVGIFPRLASTTFQDAAGARMATGTITVIKDPSGGETSATDNFRISNGVSTTFFTFFNNAGGGNTFGDGFVNIDVGGGIDRHLFMSRLFAGLQQTGFLNVQAKCDSYFDSFNSGAFATVGTCITGTLDGNMSTNTIFLVNGVAGTKGNVTILTSTTILEAVGMSGGTAS